MAKSEADTFEQADEAIDHSVGVTRGKPCIGSDLDLLWNEQPVASIVYHFGPGSKVKQENAKGKKETPKEEPENPIAETSKANSPKNQNQNSTTATTK